MTPWPHCPLHVADNIAHSTRPSRDSCAEGPSGSQLRGEALGQGSRIVHTSKLTHRSPQPHVTTSPASVNTTQCAEPHARPTTRTPSAQSSLSSSPNTWGEGALDGFEAIQQTNKQKGVGRQGWAEPRSEGIVCGYVYVIFVCVCVCTLLLL